MDWFLNDIGLRHERVKSYYSHLRIFVKRLRFFYGSEVHSLLITFLKESMKIKKVSNLNLLDRCATLIHVSPTK